MQHDGQGSQIHFITEYAFIMDYQSGIVIKSKCNTPWKVGILVVFVGYIILYGYFS